MFECLCFAILMEKVEKFLITRIVLCDWPYYLRDLRRRYRENFYIGKMPRLVLIETCFFGIIYCTQLKVKYSLKRENQIM